MPNTEVAHSWKIMVSSTTNIGNPLLYKLNGNKEDQQTLIRSMDLLALAKEFAAGRTNCMQPMLLQ